MVKNLIAGEWVDGAHVLRNINPSDTCDAFHSWRRSTPQQRFEALSNTR